MSIKLRPDTPVYLAEVILDNEYLNAGDTTLSNMLKTLSEKEPPFSIIKVFLDKDCLNLLCYFANDKVTFSKGDYDTGDASLEELICLKDYPNFSISMPS